jgi:nucleoside-diphosphate-sugar epimerase
VIREGRVLVTGGGGFVGRHLVAELLGRGIPVRALVRHLQPGLLPDHPLLEIRDTADIATAPWQELLAGADAVVHLAAVAHRPAPRSAAERQRMRTVNVGAVADLTRAACRSGVQRLVLLSSIGVLGATSGDRAFDAASIPEPHDFYSHTKLDAERAAHEASSGSSTEVCVVRPPLVFGPNAPGNFGRLVAAVRCGVPLPLGAVNNRRSLISVWNLCDLLVTCLTHPRAPLAPVLAADGESISTAELIRVCAAYLHARPVLIRVPVGVLRVACRMLGREEDFERLCGSLVVDAHDTQQRLGWWPPLDLQAGLRRALSHGS